MLQGKPDVIEEEVRGKEAMLAEKRQDLAVERKICNKVNESETP